MKKMIRLSGILIVLVGLFGLSACERIPVESVQNGYRGTGMAQIYNPRTLEEQAEKNAVPPAIPASADGPKAGAVYKNVKVLGNLSVAQFTSFMVTMTSWVAPEQGCAYCHNVANFAEDGNYTKVVSRNMIQMTQRINAEWKPHVANTGVTCYTCHRGNNIPQNVWFTSPESKQGIGFMGNKDQQNTPVAALGGSSLPYDPFTPYLLKDEKIGVNGDTALPTGNKNNIRHTEWTYGLMMHFSKSLGVNCTYCHNTRAMSNWEQSPPQRMTAWYGIRMVRDINNNHMTPITKLFPEHRLGSMGDVAKANCATCHQGAYKPLYGVSMLQDYPFLVGVPSAKPVTKAADGVVEKKTVAMK